MFKRIDRSPVLARWIERLSTFLAKRRGLPVIIGIALVIVGFVLQLLNAHLASQTLHIISLVIHNLGILTALIGLLLADPLGK